MNKQMKTLNKKKIKYKFSKTNFIAHKDHNQALSHKGLKPVTKQQSKLQSEIQNPIPSLKPPKTWTLVNVPINTQPNHPKIQLFCIIITDDAENHQ